MTASRTKRRPLVVLAVDALTMAERAAPSPFVPGHEREIAASLTRLSYRWTSLVVDDLTGLEPKLREARPDVVFNLTEGVRGARRFDATVADLIEAAGFRQTGSTGSALRLCRDKGHSKAVLAHAGLTVPRFAAVRDGRADWAAIERTVPLPVIVKPLELDGSDLLGSHSLCRSWSRAREQARRLWEVEREPVIIEEVVRGRELAVPVTRFGSTRAWRPRELRVPPRHRGLPIATGAVKDRVAASTPQPRFVTSTRALGFWATALEAAEIAADVLDVGSYARVDMIVRPDGVPVILEVNPNSCLLPQAFCLRRPAGLAAYDRLIDDIVKHAVVPRC